MAKVLASGGQRSTNLQVPQNQQLVATADILKLCLKFKPPTIAIVYQLKSRPRKYVHEFKIDLRESSNLDQICDELFLREKLYFNPEKVHRVQVMDLLKKLHAQLFPKQGNKENSSAASQQTKNIDNQQQDASRKANFFERKRFVDYAEEEGDNKAMKDKSKKNNLLDNYEDESEEGGEDPWNFEAGKPKQATAVPAKKEEKKDAAVIANSKPNPFAQNVKGAFDDLDDIDFNSSTKKKPKAAKKAEEDKGLFVDNDFGDEFEEEEADESDHGNKGASHGGNKEDIFNNSRSKDNKAQPASAAHQQNETEEDEEEDPEAQAKLIESEFKKIYDSDPQLRELLGQDTSALTLEEKYQILEAYMKSGGVAGMLAADEGEDKVAEGGDLTEEDQHYIEEQFAEIYQSDPELREMLGEDLSALSIKDKYQILLAYKKGGGVAGLLAATTGAEGPAAEEEDSVIEYEGKKFKRVQIEGDNQEYLMDEEGNIYDGQFNFIGQANGSDDDEEL